MPGEVWSTLISILSEKVLPMAELDDEVLTKASMGCALELPVEPSAPEEIRRIVTVFRELHDGVTGDSKTKLLAPTTCTRIWKWAAALAHPYTGCSDIDI
jgi:hypothetical protein